MAALERVSLDGSRGEGGGQIVRTALFLSVLTQRPFEVTRIRAGRPKPGLKAQHAAIVELLRRMTDSTAEGDRVGSERLVFEPGPPRAGSHRHDLGTAGSITLVLQTLLPVMLATPGHSRLRLRGGTDVPYSPTLDWFVAAIVNPLASLARRLDVRPTRRGFYPPGGGTVEIDVEGIMGRDWGHEAFARLVAERLGGLPSEPARVIHVGGSSLAHESLREARVAQRQAEAARSVLVNARLPTPRIDVGEVAADSPGSAITVWLRDAAGHVLAADSLGRPGKRAELVGQEAAHALTADWDLGATVDRHAADHWAPWVALGARPVLVPEVTGHLATNIEVVEAFLGPGALALEGRWLTRPSPDPPSRA